MWVDPKLSCVYVASNRASLVSLGGPMVAHGGVEREGEFEGPIEPSVNRPSLVGHSRRGSGNICSDAE